MYRFLYISADLPISLYLDGKIFEIMIVNLILKMNDFMRIFVKNARIYNILCDLRRNRKIMITLDDNVHLRLPHK